MSYDANQSRWTAAIDGALNALVGDDANTIVLSGIAWNPIIAEPDICATPTTMVIFGRPKGTRAEYNQWQENDIAPQVVFEVLTDTTDRKRLMELFEFYDQYGVEEYYLYNPERGRLQGLGA